MDGENRDNIMNEAANDVARFDRNRRFQPRRRTSYKIPDYVDWKDVEFLRRFIPERGKIMPRRISGITAKDQRRVSQAIKRARSMALVPFVLD
jgi:small subunit ribosomal protein S18